MTKDDLLGFIKQFEYYKLLGEKTFLQLSDEKLFWQYNDQSNSIAMIVRHLSGNMLSRWTDFLTSDGEKSWRNRDSEFENYLTTRASVLETWNVGWSCLFEALNALTENNFENEILIRNQKHSVSEAISRQLAHYPYHIGQMVFLGKMLCDKNWISLSIPKGNSNAYNETKFIQPIQKVHFADEFLKKND